MNAEPMEQQILSSVEPAVTENGAADTSSPAWQSELAPELGRFVEQKGWRSATDVISSYRHLERLVGAERLALPPADAGPDAWNPVWEKLGRPKDAAGYELAVPSGRAYDSGTADWFRETAHRIGLTAAQAQALHDGFLARMPLAARAPVDDAISGVARDGEIGAVAPGETMGAVAPGETMGASWGRQFDANMNSARRAYAAFLGEEAPFHDIADAIGETALMQMLAKVGRLIGEDSITGRAGGGSGPRNPAEALAEIAKLQRAAQADGNHPYVSKTHPEHQNLVKRMEALYALAYGG